VPPDSARPGARRVPILLYHGVGPDRRDEFEVTSGQLRDHMEAVVASGRRTQTISELVPTPVCRKPTSMSTAVTFDDGTADFYSRAWPILRELGVKATLYVVAGSVGKRYCGRPMLSWRSLAELRDEGVEIGAHGQRHVALDLLTADRAAMELANSKLTLEDGLGAAVASFAYPFGYHTALVKQLVRSAGYTSACAVKNRLSHTEDDRFALARMTIRADTVTDDIEALAGGRGAATARTREALATRAWRAYRRARTAVGR
jgi:peptidoglycan/xylan/chitin deacetylase (PgdA/CDA1 family)